MAGRKGLIWETAEQPTRVEAGLALSVVIRHPLALLCSQRADKQEELDKDLAGWTGPGRKGRTSALGAICSSTHDWCRASMLGSVTLGFPSLLSSVLSQTGFLNLALFLFGFYCCCLFDSLIIFYMYITHVVIYTHIHTPFPDLIPTHNGWP